MNIFIVLVIVAYLFVLIEYGYSVYRQDGFYSSAGTMNNILRGVFLEMLSIRMTTLYLGLFLLWSRPYAFYTPRVADLNIIFFLVCLVCVDLCWYVFHRVHHSFAFPWALHSVHHGDDRLNLSTAFRISWTEQIYLFFFFLPVLLLGFHPFLFFLAIFYLNTHQFFCHSQYIAFPRFFDYLLVTPHNHRIHHDQASRNQNSNFGAVFSIWDRLFGTYVAEIDTFTPGIKGYHQNNFIKMEVAPVSIYFRKLFASKPL